MIVNVEETLAMITEKTPRIDGESAKEYAARVLHLTWLEMEHGKPVCMQTEEDEKEREA